MAMQKDVGMKLVKNVVALVAVLGLSVGCANMQGLAGAVGTRKAAPKSEKEINACTKMCEVAGDTENNKAGVDACKADCRK
jgi:hypothetical protein